MNVRIIAIAAVAILVGSTAFAAPPAKTGHAALGDVLTNDKGMTLYTYDKDTAGQAATCADKCAAAWPPAFASADAKPVGDFTLVKSADGKDIWAYYGMPLYGWIKDKKPGETTGDMVGNVWHTAIEK